MENLPVEILHRIFAHLNIETLFFSIRPLSRYLRSTVDNYDRLNFHLKILSKCHFDVLCRLISPSNIQSLTLYYTYRIPDQISEFLSRIDLQQLTRLHSIDLDQIEEYQLNYLFERINLNHLQSVRIHLSKHDDHRRKTTANHLSTIVQQSNLRTIEFNIPNNRLSQIEWPSICSIECLILYEYENLVKIYSCSPRLHRLIIKGNLFNSNHLTCSFPQLTSFIIDEISMRIDEVEAFLLLTPSLVYLKLIGYCDIFDGRRWEDFIQENLPHLTQFEFEITSQRSFINYQRDLNLFIQSYRSAFWMELKKWFIRVEVDLDEDYFPWIYSLPMCRCTYQRELNSNRIVCSTSDEIDPTKNISELILSIQSLLKENVLLSMNIPRSNLTKLHLSFKKEIPLIYAKDLENTIDVSQLVEVRFVLDNHRFYQDDKDFLAKFFTSLQKSPRLSSLILHIWYNQHTIYPNLETLIEYLPRQIHRLEIPINEIKQIEMILERCQQLSVVEFYMQKIEQSKEIEQWFERNTLGSIYHKDHFSETIWIGKKKETTNYCNQKRMKFNEE